MRIIRPGGDEQDDRERDLGDDERVARAVTLAAGAREAAAFLERRREVRRRELQHRDQAEEESCEQRNREREEQDERIDADLSSTRQPVGRIGDQRADAGVGETEPDDAADERERQALRQELPGDPARARAERGVDRQLLLPRLGAHQEQVGDVRAGDQQDEPDRAEQHPQHPADVADDVDRQRPDVRPELHVLEHLPREARRHREPIRDHRHHPRDVGVRLLERDARLQARDPLVAEVADVKLGAIEAERQHELRVAVEEAEAAPEGRR